MRGLLPAGKSGEYRTLIVQSDQTGGSATFCLISPAPLPRMRSSTSFEASLGLLGRYLAVRHRPVPVERLVAVDRVELLALAHRAGVRGLERDDDVVRVGQLRLRPDRTQACRASTLLRRVSWRSVSNEAVGDRVDDGLARLVQPFDEVGRLRARRGRTRASRSYR